MMLYFDLMTLDNDVMMLYDNVMMYMMLTWWSWCMILRWCETYDSEMTYYDNVPF